MSPPALAESYAAAATRAPTCIRAALAGATGRLLFGALGFLLAVPMLVQLRRRSGSWRVPVGALALMAVVFTSSSLVVGPALTGDDDGAAPARDVPAAPAGVSPAEHESHQRYGPDMQPVLIHLAAPAGGSP